MNAAHGTFYCGPTIEVENSTLSLSASTRDSNGQYAQQAKLKFTPLKLTVQWEDGTSKTLDLEDTTLIDAEVTKGGRWSSDEFLKGIDYNYSIKRKPSSSLSLVTLVFEEDLDDRFDSPESEVPGDKIAAKIGEHCSLHYVSPNPKAGLLLFNVGKESDSNKVGMIGCCSMALLAAWAYYFIQ